jgi:hypothetical protein
VSTAFRILGVLAIVAFAIALLMGPAWRGSFYRSWLRPRLVAFGIIMAVLAAGAYLFRVINAVRPH